MSWFDKKSRKWRFRGNGGVIGTSPSKALANQAEAKAKERTFMVAQGMIDPAIARIADQGKINITAHVEAYCNHLRDRKRSDKHVATVELRLPKVFLMGGLKYLSDATATNLSSAISTYAGSGVSEQTVSHAWVQSKAFLKWCVRDKRIASNPLDGMDAPAVTTQRRPRRAATAEELAKIIAAAARGRAGRWVASDRQSLMILMCGAGFRAGDCPDLTPESFDLLGDGFVTISAVASKNKKKSVQPLPPEVKAMLMRWLAAKPIGKRVFPDWRPNTSVARMVYGCLKHAGITKQTAAGIIDGHALRHTYATMAAKGTDIKTLQRLMRHSSIVTTARYMHTDDEQQRAAMNAFPKIMPQQNGGLGGEAKV